MRRILVRVFFRVGWFFDKLAVRLDHPLYLRLWTESARRWQDRENARQVARDG